MLKSMTDVGEQKFAQNTVATEYTGWEMHRSVLSLVRMKNAESNVKE